MSEPLSSYARSRAHLEDAPASGATRRWGPEDAIPTDYRGITFRSALESAWARTLDHYGITDWEYEPETVQLASGTRYVPDFRIDSLRTFIEVKGPHMLRVDKTAEFAREKGSQTIVMLGFSSLQRSISTLWDGYMQWLDPLGYDMRFTQCGSCSAWQWLRPQVSRSCRQCKEICTGLLALPGEMAFTAANDEPYQPPAWTPL